MKYEELVNVWKSQDEHTPFSIDEVQLHNRIRFESLSYGKRLGLIQWAAIIVLFSLSVKALVAASSHINVPFYLFSFAVTFSAAAYQIWMLRCRHKYELNFEESQRGLLAKSISRIDYLVSLLRAMVWCFALPLFLLAGAKAYFDNANKALIAILALSTILAVSIVVARREIRLIHWPKKQGLQRLLEQVQLDDVNVG